MGKLWKIPKMAGNNFKKIAKIAKKKSGMLSKP
jgi:hypothetical protein